MLRFLTLLLACAALALAAGCGDDDDNSSGDAGGGGGYGSAPAETETTETTETQESTAADASGGTKIAVRMKDINFSPETVQAKVGDTIVWTNDDDVAHNVVGGDLKSETFGKDGTYEYKADEVETIKYECTLHPGMEGTIEVTN